MDVTGITKGKGFQVTGDCPLFPSLVFDILFVHSFPTIIYLFIYILFLVLFITFGCKKHCRFEHSNMEALHSKCV